MATSFSRISAVSKSDAALLVFCRAPQLGQVKTRLASALGAPRALEIYRAMLRDCFDLGRALAPAVTTFACFTPTDGFDEASPLRALWDGAALAQHGEDLGARMLNALADARARGFARVAIIGSDAPDLPLSHLQAAFAALRESAVVVAPSADGGFVLIGAACPLPDAIFSGIVWSRDDVCARLLHNLRALDLSFTLLEPWHDVDGAADLQALKARLQKQEDVALATRKLLF